MSADSSYLFLKLMSYDCCLAQKVIGNTQSNFDKLSESISNICAERKDENPANVHFYSAGNGLGELIVLCLLLENGAKIDTCYMMDSASDVAIWTDNLTKEITELTTHIPKLKYVNICYIADVQNSDILVNDGDFVFMIHDQVLLGSFKNSYRIISAREDFYTRLQRKKIYGASIYKESPTAQLQDSNIVPIIEKIKDELSGSFPGKQYEDFVFMQCGEKYDTLKRTYDGDEKKIIENRKYIEENQEKYNKAKNIYVYKAHSINDELKDIIDPEYDKKIKMIENEQPRNRKEKLKALRSKYMHISLNLGEICDLLEKFAENPRMSVPDVQNISKTLLLLENDDSDNFPGVNHVKGEYGKIISDIISTTNTIKNYINRGYKSTDSDFNDTIVSLCQLCKSTTFVMFILFNIATKTNSKETPAAIVNTLNLCVKYGYILMYYGSILLQEDQDKFGSRWKKFILL